MINNLINKLVNARANLTVYNDMYNERFEAWKNANGEMINSLNEAKSEVTSAEAELKKAILDEYEVTKNKKVAPGCGVREYDEIVYNEDEALAWCIKHGGIGLTVDKKAFEQLVKSGAVKDKTIASIKKKPSATLASSLEAVPETPEITKESPKTLEWRSTEVNGVKVQTAGKINDLPDEIPF